MSLPLGASSGSYHCHPADLAYGEENDKVTNQPLSSETQASQLYNQKQTMEPLSFCFVKLKRVAIVLDLVL